MRGRGCGSAGRRAFVPAPSPSASSGLSLHVGPASFFLRAWPPLAPAWPFLSSQFAPHWWDLGIRSHRWRESAPSGAEARETGGKAAGRYAWTPRSLSLASPSPPPPPSPPLFFFSSESGTGTKTAEECQEACKKRKGCNAWLFCASLDGCAPGPGDTCEAHLAAGKLASRFGTFGAKGGDVDPCVGEDHARYPPLMCALKKVPDTANPIINDP